MSGKRILIVDDDSSVARILVRVFARAGFTVQTAGNGRQAVAALSAERIDVLITDIQMPEMDGRQLCRQLATTGPYLPPCTFVVTSRSETEERVWVGEYPNVVLVEKPVSPKQMLRLVTRGLEAVVDPTTPEEEGRAA